ncbi:MAG TPA: amidohydrolase family protein, partial [Blastocatellia bacterium]|nr:amidohydrolase family protein [Blastocatellia bacterium]
MRQKSFYLTLGIIMLIAVPALVSLAIKPESARAFDGESYAIRGGTVVTVTGATIPKGVIIIRNGLIAAVGADIPVPGDARIIEAAGMTIYPGLFDAYSNYGARPAPTPPASRAEALAQPTAVPATLGLLPEVTIVDQLQITENTFDQQRSAGITTALTGPNAGIFQGQSALINLGTESAEKLILRAPFSLNVGFNSARGGYPNSLMGVFSFLRQSLIDARYYQEEWARYQRAPRGAERPPVNKSLAALQPVINGEMPVVFNTGTVREMKRAIGLAEEFKLKYLLSGATESYQIADYLKSKQATVLLSLSFPQRPPGLEDPESELLRVLRVRAEAPKSAAALYKAGVKFAFSSGTLTRPQDYIVNAARAIEAGLPPDVALKALTIYPAEIFGVSEQLGSIERGKIANLILATGDLFNKETKVKNVFIDGKLYDIKPPDPARPA